MSAARSDEEGALDRLASVNRALGAIQRIDPSAARMQELFDAGFYALDELSRAVADYAGSVDLDPDRLASVRRRRDVLYSLVKKYGPTLEGVIETGKNARAELDLVDSAGFDIAQLTAREAAAREQLVTEAKRLTAMRVAAARKLSKAVDALFPDLGMPGRKFSARSPSGADSDERGAEDVEFRVALNVGHDERPLARVASGGELSRVMLALKTILARADEVPTLVFDEVDSGIGGRVGLQVGDTLRRVARASPGVRHLASAADRRSRAPSHCRGERREGRRHDRRHHGARGNEPGERDRADAGRRSGEQGEPRAREGAARDGRDRVMALWERRVNPKAVACR